VPRLRFRLPARADSCAAHLARILPRLDRDDRRRLFAAGHVRLANRVVDRAATQAWPGARVEIEEIAESGLEPLPELAGPRLHALVDAPPWPGGAIALAGGRSLEFAVLARRNGLAWLRIDLEAPRAAEVCSALFRAGMPVVGDLIGGGLGLAGGARLVDGSLSGFGAQVADSGWPDLCWPEEPAWLDDEDREAFSLRVSRETRRAIERGHPWLLEDDSTEEVSAHRRGGLLHVVSREGSGLGWARVEAHPPRLARLWARGNVPRAEIPSVASRVARALARRRDLLASAEPATDAFRLIHGEADELPGLFVDRLGPLLRCLVTSRVTEGWREEVFDALLRQWPVTPEGQSWSVLEVLHLPVAAGVEGDAIRWRVGGPERLAASGAELADEGFWVWERGLRFFVDPGWHAVRAPRPGFGLFLDQRENRARLAAHAARGGRWLNLFCHTGAFSLSLLAAGASAVESVDLSRPYLERLEKNLGANRAFGVDPARHRSIRGDARRALESSSPGQRYAGIVLDPPTAAAAGRHFWSVRQDLEPLIVRCVDRLDEAGVLLVTQNQRGAPLGLDAQLEAAVRRAGRRIRRLEPAPAGGDHPTLEGFPEGDPFEGWLLALA